MPRIRILAIAVLIVFGLYGDATVHAQRDENPQDGRGQREGGRRGRGGFGGGFGPGFGGGGLGARGGLLGLLRIEEVRTELKIAEDQQELISALADDLNEGRPEFPANFRDLSEDERQAFFRQMQDWSAKQDQQARATLLTILQPEQYQRLAQIHIQVQGVAALADEEVATKLNLSADQKARITAVIDENSQKMRDEMRAAFGPQRGERGDLQEMREKMEAMRKAGDEQVLAVLTVEQKTAFEAMKGEKFDLPQRGFGGPGGFRGPGFGGGRGAGNEGGRPGRPRRPE